MKKLLTALVLALGLLGAGISSPAQAADQPDAIGQWRAPVATVFVGQGLRDGTWPIEQVLTSWSAGPVRLVPVATRAEADIRLQRSNYANLNGYGGLTKPWVVDGYYNRCRVRVASETYDFSRLGLLTHEVGHCLGLPDNYAPEAEVSVMSYDDMYQQTGPTALDLATLAAIYATPPGG